MASNSFGTLFRITTFGESHGTAIGTVVDGCPAGLWITEEEINEAMQWRRPGNNPYTTSRKERDTVQILSGVFQGQTTGAPIALLIQNEDADSSAYEPIKDLFRPGHANYTYIQKYGHYDYRGGGRASARETAARVAAGAIAKKLLSLFEIDLCTFVAQIGEQSIASLQEITLQELKKNTRNSPIFCPILESETAMLQELDLVQKEGDSLGAILQTITSELPAGLGDPIYGKMEAKLASAMLSIPATKGFEIGSGFASARMKGSEHNDRFIMKGNAVRTETNFAGGVLGGITTSMPLTFRVAFKPTSSIKQEMSTLNLEGKSTTIRYPEHSRHDPCVAIRAVSIVEAMTALVLADTLLLNRTAQIFVAAPQ